MPYPKASVTYVWHLYIIQESKDAAYHVSSLQIAYNANYKSTYGFLADYSDVQDVWMQGTSSAEKAIVFETNFKAGSNASQTAYKGGGDLKQLGCIYLLDHDSSISNYKDLLHYYYDNSPRSQGGAVQFFDADKNFISQQGAKQGQGEASGEFPLDPETKKE